MTDVRDILIRAYHRVSAEILVDIVGRDISPPAGVAQTPPGEE